MGVLWYWILVFALLFEYQSNAQPILDNCIKSGLASSRHQSLVQKFGLRLDVVNIVREYESALGDSSREYVPFMEEEYLLEVSMFLFHRNEIVIDYFWDSMMETLPATWHVYGTRPAQASIIRSRFMESCACNIYSLHKEGRIEKFHTLVPTLRDARYLTLGKVNEICRKIKEAVEGQGLELTAGVQVSGRSNVLTYYRCAEANSDELADILLSILDKRVPGLNISKFKVCKIVDTFQRSPVAFRGSCIKSLDFGLKEYLLFDKVNDADIEFTCDIVDNLRKFAGLFSEDSIKLPREGGINEIIVKSLKRVYPDMELTNIGMEIVRLVKISEHRFIESCVNFSETLFALQGLKRVSKNSMKSPGKLSGFGDEWDSTSTKEGDMLYPILGDFKDIRKKLLLTCSGIHMYLLDLKPKGVSFTKLRNSRIATRKDFEAISKSKFLMLDSCKSEYVITFNKYTISQDTLAEMILSAISNSSSRSTSSGSLYNGVVKEPICKISGDIIGLMGKNISTSPRFEETSFIRSCRQIIIENAISNHGIEPLNLVIKRSTIKLCNIVAKSLATISRMRKLSTNGDLGHLYDDEPTSSECISEES